MSLIERLEIKIMILGDCWLNINMMQSQVSVTTEQWIKHILKFHNGQITNLQIGIDLAHFNSCSNTTSHILHDHHHHHNAGWHCRAWAYSVLPLHHNHESQVSDNHSNRVSVRERGKGVVVGREKEKGAILMGEKIKNGSDVREDRSGSDERGFYLGCESYFYVLDMEFFTENWPCMLW